MTRLAYIDWNPSEASLAIVNQANRIIAEYQQKGYALTLRQLYYQFVARDLFANKQSNYNMLGRIISDARMAGLVSWHAIEDRGRNLRGHRTFSSPIDPIKAARLSYKRDLWKDQDFMPEVWVEKQALEGVIGSICSDLRVDFFATKGYNSQSEQWRAGQRFASYVQRGQRPIVFHLGDHDPAGIDMTRDNQERLSLFAGTQVMVVRLALNMNQVEHYRPPENPVKMTDSKADGYIAQYGEHCWELDALQPEVIHSLIEEAIKRIRNEAKWNTSLQAEVNDKDVMDVMIREIDPDWDPETEESTDKRKP